MTQQISSWINAIYSAQHIELFIIVIIGKHCNNCTIYSVPNTYGLSKPLGLANFGWTWWTGGPSRILLPPLHSLSLPHHLNLLSPNFPFSHPQQLIYSIVSNCINCINSIDCATSRCPPSVLGCGAPCPPTKSTAPTLMSARQLSPPFSAMLSRTRERRLPSWNLSQLAL